MITLVIALICACDAVSAANVIEFNSIDGTWSGALRANAAPPMFAAHVAAYYCAQSCNTVTPDGGEGLFVAGAGRCDRTTDDDGGYKIVDHYDPNGDDKGTCWYRQNINGDLRQFGATWGSIYDCKHGGISSCASVNDPQNLPTILRRFAARGIRRVLLRFR
jgi:hypothetical protein